MSNKCAAFWNMASVRSNGDVHPCCRFKKPVTKFNGSLGDILKSSEFKELRKRSSNNEQIPECSKCFLEEKLGKQSLRQEYNKTFTTDTVELKFVDLSFNNICNLACDGCWGDWSSKWNELIYGKSNNNYRQITNIDTVPDSLEEVWFLGGEPLMTNLHYKFLTKVNDLSNLTVLYNTNGTFLLKDHEIELLLNAKKVTFNLSIDGYGELNNNVRSGSDWNDILKFIDQISSTSFNLSIHTVIHKNNWQGLSEISTFVDSLMLPWTINMLTYPNKLSVKGLSSKEKNKLRKILKSIYIPNKEYILGFINEK